MNTNKNTFYFHTKTEGKKRSTIAGVIDGKTIRFGVATCSNKDQFVKQKGRVLAQGRAKSSNPLLVVPIKDMDKTGHQFVSECKNIIEDFQL